MLPITAILVPMEWPHPVAQRLLARTMKRCASNVQRRDSTHADHGCRVMAIRRGISPAMLCGNMHNQGGVLLGALTRRSALALGSLPECLLPMQSQLR